MNESQNKNGDKEVAGEKPNLITVLVRFQADEVKVSINVNASIEALLAKAIKETGNEGTDKDRFQLKLDGVVLDTKKKVSDYKIKDGTRLVLTLIAGGGGNC